MVKDAAELVEALKKKGLAVSSKVLIVAEHDGAQAQCQHRQVRHAARARSRALRSRSLVCAADAAAVAAQAAQLAGVDAGADGREPGERARRWPRCWRRRSQRWPPPYTHVLGPSTTFGKDLMPRVAALLEAPQVSDIMAVESATRFRRPIYAGNAILTVEARADAQASWPRCARPRSRRPAAAAARAIEKAGGRRHAADAHALRVRVGSQERPPGPADRRARGLRRPGARQRRELQDPLQPRRQARRRGRRLARRGGRRLRAERPAGRPDRQDHRARSCTSPSASPARSST